MPLLDDLVDALPDVNLRLNNLFEYEDGKWQANVSDRDTFVGYEFGRGGTPTEALLNAIRAAGVKIDE